MKRNLLEKIIKLIKEQPTNATGTAVPGTGDDSSTVVVKKKKRYIWTRGIRKNWKTKDESQ
tara:strand:+ start:284 stop:466 length:183 start_codon:yes stop_codon:yes gene_type:complete